MGASRWRLKLLIRSLHVCSSGVTTRFPNDPVESLCAFRAERLCGCCGSRLSVSRDVATKV